MQGKDFLKPLGLTTVTAQTIKLQALSTITSSFAASDKMPVLFTSHGNPMDIPLGLHANPFLTSLAQVGEKVRKDMK